LVLLEINGRREYLRRLFYERILKMKFLLIAAALFAIEANAYVVPTFRDIKPATQVMVEKQTVTAPLLAVATRLKGLTATSATLVTTISTFTLQPDVPRNIVITTGGTTADCKLATVVVNGTNFFGAAISENFAITDNQAGATTGAKAFKTVTSVVIPAQDGAGCTYSVGTGAKLGLKACMASADHFFHAGIAGVKEATAPTIAASATAVESNTATLSTALSGVDVNLFFAQNFACHQ
jgi:hypothetical protein